MRQLAGSIGTAILVTVMTTQSTNHLNAFATELDKTNPVIQDHVREMAAQYGGQQGALQVILAYVNKLASIEGINDAFWIATALSVLAFVLSLFLKGKKGAEAEHNRLMSKESNKF